MNIVKLKKYFNVDFLAALMIFFNSYPYFFWHTHFQNYIIFPFLFYYSVRNMRILKFKELALLMILFFVLLILSINEKITIIISYVSLLFIYSIKLDKMLVVYHKLKRILVCIFCLSLLVYILAVVLSINLPYVVEEPLNVGKLYTYKAYPFLVVENLNLPFYRFSSVFDEPGVVGTITALLLYADRYNMKRKENIILLVSGLFSFSFFFILSTLVYYLLVNPFLLMGKSIKLLFIILISFSLFYQLTKDNPNIDRYLYSRFLIKDGKLNGDNRTDVNFDTAYDKFVLSDKKWFGMGKGESFKVADDVSSYKLMVYDYGFVWFAFFLLFWFGSFFCSVGDYKIRLVAMFIFLMTIYQRPGSFSPFSFFLFLLVPLNLIRKKYQKSLL